MQKRTEPIHWLNIKIVVDGIEITGTYSVDKTDWMTVRMDGGGTKHARGGPDAEGVAKIMLSELYAKSVGR